MDDHRTGAMEERREIGEGWQLRAAGPDDAEACAAIAVMAFQRVHDSYATILGAALHDLVFAGWQQAKASEVAEAVREHPEHALVAIVGDRIIGFVTFSFDRVHQTGQIGNNAVDPRWQGRGIATGMYRAVLEHMRAAGMRAAYVGTGLDEGHAPARAAYQKAGFQLAVPHVTYYQEL